MIRPMPRVPPFDRKATYADLEKLPNQFVAEMVGGELYASPRPAPPHAVAGAGLGMAVGPPFHQGRGGPGGWWILYEPELHLESDVLVPDWAGWRRSRLPEMPAAAFFTLAPDWVCEILSPSTVTFDRGRKLDAYASAGVSYAWLIDPVTRTLEALCLDDGRWYLKTTIRDSDVAYLEPFDAVELRLGDLWASSSPGTD
jgi:Uma2 family endonuclease